MMMSIPVGPEPNLSGLVVSFLLTVIILWAAVVLARRM